MNTNDAIKVLKENGLKYTDKRKRYARYLC